MKIPLYQIDAFSNKPFRGNPAAICPLTSWLPDETMQSIAAENNLAETAFFVPEGPLGRFGLRWFTPAVEVDLCGHATLAAAHLILDYLQPGLPQVWFDSKSGELTVKKVNGKLTLDFPSRPPAECTFDPSLLTALGGKPEKVLGARDYLVVYESEDDVRALKPNMQALMEIDRFAVIVTAPGRDADFVSRFFAPAKGVAEDPVTGSAHCTLIPYWAERLGKNKLHALQVSQRGGELWCELHGDRVWMSGHAVRVIEGHFFLD
ncbi:MAG: PhzF family phenazine biosynthesis protein [Bryobacteraceae bacterium]